MNSKRVLLSCTVVSVRNSIFAYPSCKQCVCAITQQDLFRYKCHKCGISCDVQNVDYRYRLSLKVARDSSLFGVTVFGSCLNPFFGITASGLQRFVDTEKKYGPQILHQLLIKAVKDCFIGKCFIFGFKLSHRDANRCLLGENIFASAESEPIVACQVLPPDETFLGFTVFAYLQILLQANAQPRSSTKIVSHLHQKDSLVSSFDHTLPLCLSSNLDSSLGLTCPHPWQAMPDLFLFCTEEQSSGSSHQLSVDEFEHMRLQYVPEFESSQVSKNAERTDSGLQSRPTLHKSSLSSVATEIYSPSLSPVLNTTNVTHDVYATEQQRCRHWVSPFRDCNASSHTALTTSFAFEDAPLSETLGDFVKLEPHIREPLFVYVPSPTCKLTANKRDRVIPEKLKLENDTLYVQSMTTCQPVHMPLCNILNDKDDGKPLKGKFTKPCVSDSFTGMYSKRNSLIKNTVSKRGWLQNDRRSFKHQSLKEQENTFESHEDGYNCSADLFQQNSLEMKVSVVTQSSVSYNDKQKDHSLLDTSALQREVSLSSLHFAPTLQSTPIADPYLKHSYGLRCKFNKKWLQNAKTEMPCKNINVANGQINSTQRPKVEKSESDSFLENSGSSAGGFDVTEGGKDELSASINEWSRDLFDCEFNDF